jgi:hypothetical protein
LLQQGNYNGHHQVSHTPHHEVGTSHFVHGPPNLIHNYEGAEHEYGVHGQGDVYGAGNTYGGAFTRRSFTDVKRGSISAPAKRSEGADKHKFTTTRVPRYIQYFHDPGLRKEIVVAG